MHAAGCALSLGGRKEKWTAVQPSFMGQLLPQWPLGQAGLHIRAFYSSSAQTAIPTACLSLPYRIVLSEDLEWGGS